MFQSGAESESDQSGALLQDHVTCPTENMPVLEWQPNLADNESMNLLLLILLFIFIIWKIANWIYSFGSCFLYCILFSFGL